MQQYPVPIGWQFPYTPSSMATLEKDYGQTDVADTGAEDRISAEMRNRENAVRSFRNRYESLMNKTGFGGKDTTKMTLEWFDKMKLTDDTRDYDSIYWREDFMEKDTVVREGEAVYAQFTSLMAKAKPHISDASYNKWFERLRDTSEISGSESSFKIKARWIRNELPGYVERWKKVSDERDTLVADRRFSDLVAYDPSFAVLKNKGEFLALHYDRRVGMVASARAALLSSEKMQLDLYAKAKQKLLGAESKGILGAGKSGVWLERIFKSNADIKKIEAFVHGTGKNSLSDLMINWHNVKVRYDKLMQKASERGQDTAARGFKLVSEHQFLSMHYAQRLQYVEEAGHRLNDSVNIKEEQPVFVKIRHAMDVKDWVEASMLIAKAKTMHLKESDWPRLKSMERYVTQFSKKIEAKDATQLTEAKQKIDFIVQQVPSELQPMVVRLLRGPHGNRNIHQFRWIVYNNKWCRDHGYLNQQKARSGASQQNKELTKLRAKQGVDVGRNDVLDEDTSGQEFIRKKEYANHKATLMHVNMKGAAANTLAQWLEHEQDPKVLYWTTFCGHEDGDPKSDNWHNDLFANLTELRSLMRTVNNAGFMYDGPARRLLGRN
jgi:hypothetical protein